ncbi:MAG: heme A synthase, partial [Acidimicrobiales bacterium]
AVLLRRRAAPAGVRRRAAELLGVIAPQALVGYAQYFTGVPVLLVGIHILGASLVWIATVRLHLAMAGAPAAAGARGAEGRLGALGAHQPARA